MLKSIICGLVFASITSTAFGGARGDTKISSDGKLLIQLQDFPYTDGVTVFDLTSKKARLSLTDAHPLLFDISKTNCFASANTFVFVQKIAPSVGYYELVLFDLTSGLRLGSQKVTSASAIACNAAEEKIFVAYEGFIQVLDGRTLSEKTRVKVYNWGAVGFSSLSQIAVSPDGKLAVLTDDNDHGFKIYELETGKLLASDSFPYQHDVVSVAFSPDSSLVLVIGQNGLGKVYSLADGSVALQFGHGADWERLAGQFDKSGRLFIADEFRVINTSTAVTVSAFGRPPFKQEWSWQVPGYTNFNSIEVSNVTGQIVLDTMLGTYIVDAFNRRS